MKSIFLLFFIFISLVAQAQNIQISGTITGSDTKEPLVNGLITISNGEQKYQVLSNLDGQYKITLKETGKYTLEAMFLGYKNYASEITITKQTTQQFDVVLQSMFTELTEVEIVGDVPIVIKEDTIQFSSSSYKTHDDATAEDLVTKIPGVEKDDNGGITAEGESVKKILVDGKEFFGDDPKSAMNNLPAEMIDYVQIIDQKSDQAEFTGFDDGQRSKAINFVTKKDAKYAYFGKAEAGYGSDQRYSAGGNINIFKGDQRLSFTGLSNNVNQQGFMSDNLTSGPKRGRRGKRGGGNSSPSNNMNAKSNGINTSHSIGTNYIDTWGDKMDVSGSYTYKSIDNETDETSSTEYLISEGTNQIVDEILNVDSHKENHNFNFRMDYNVSPNTSIRIRPIVKLENGNGANQSLSTTALKEGAALNSSTMSDFNTTNSADINNSFLLRHKLNDNGRTLTLDWKLYYHNDDTYQDVFTNINYYENDGTQNDSTAQRILGDTEKFRTSADLIFTEKLAKNLQLKLNYFQSWEKQDADRKTYDIMDDTNNGDFIEQLSNTFTSQQNIYRPEAGLLFKKDKLNITTSLQYQYSSLHNESIYPTSETTTTDFGHWLPSVFFNYSFSRSKRIKFSYQKNVSLPNVTNLQSVIDYSDPLNITSGNPYLKGEDNHVLRFNYKNFNLAAKELFFINITAQKIDNKITQYTFIAENDTTINGVPLKKGSSYTYPINLDGYINARGVMVFSKPIKPIKTNVSSITTAGYTRNVGITNDITSFTYDSSLGQGVKLASNISKKVDFNISGMMTYHWISNNENTSLNGNYLHSMIRASLNIEPIQRLILNTSFIGNIYNGDDDLIQDNIYKWNAAVAYKLFKKRQGEIRFSVSDILNQNSSINRTVTESYIQTSTYNVLPRYFMFSLIYRPKGKTNPKKGGRGRDFMRF